MKKLLILLLVIVSIAPLSASEGEKYTLPDLIKAMEAGNADLLKAGENIAKAALDTKDAKGAYTPTIDLLVSGTYMANPSLGNVTINPDEIKIGDNNKFGAQSGVPKGIGDNKMVIGSPAINATDFAKQVVYMKKLPALFKDVENLKQLLDNAYSRRFEVTYDHSAPLRRQNS